MSFAGVPFKQPFQPLRASDWNTLVTAVDSVYLLSFYTNQMMFNGTASPYFYSLYTVDGAFFGSEIYVEGYKVLHDLDPIYIASFLAQAQSQLYNFISVYLITIDSDIQTLQGIDTGIYNQLSSLYQIDSSIESTIQSMQSQLSNLYSQVQSIYSQLQSMQSTVQAIKLYASPTALSSFVIPVLSTPVSLVSSTTPVKRVHLFVTTDTAYVVYVGGPNGQHFPIPPGTSFTIDICDAYQVWLRSQNYSYVRALLELTGGLTCN